MAIGHAVQKYRAKQAEAEAKRLAAVEAGLKAPAEYDPADAAREREALAELSVEETAETNAARAARIRHKKTGKIRRAKFLMAVDVLSMEGLSVKEIAETLGVSYQQVSAARLRLRNNADMESQTKRLDDIAVPLAVDNVIIGVKNGSQFYTDRVMSGRGLYRTHKSVETTEKFVPLDMTIRVEMPDHVTLNLVPGVRPGAVVGAPMVIDVTPSKQLPSSNPAPATVGIGTPDVR